MVATAWRALQLRAGVGRAPPRLRGVVALQQRGARIASSSSGDAAARDPRRRPPTIALTPAESSLFDFLLYIQHLHAPTTQLRVAGGWVRDKLRGAESEDIDVVLDNIYGKEFASHITKFQRQRKLPMSSVGVVKANSDKSKHLEVAQVKVDGHMVDFVHLRSEAYTDDSRVPDAQFAAPAEDALRRDTTINALFYNLHTREVEDFTGRGLDDLARGIVRTPLEPHQTFLDDPLRVLRVVRFACEFGFSLDPAIVESVLGNADIRDAMKRKVSRERVGIEVKKMLSGADPARAFQLLSEFALLDIVFHHAGGDGAVAVGDIDDRAAALRELFTWTPELVARGEHHVRHLQAARLALDKHKISFMEATAAILAPFVVPRDYITTLLPALATLLPAASSGDDAHWLRDVDESLLIDTALEYRATVDRAMASFPREALVELLKHNVKWSKPAAKRVTHILEAVLAFPSTLSADHVARNHVQLYLWSRKFHDVLSPAIAILLTELAPASEREAFVDALDALATRFTQPPPTPQQQPPSRAAVGNQEAKKRPARRVDGRLIRDRLGGDVGPKIGLALEVLAAFEFVYPSATLDQELAFLDRLYPFLK